MTVVKAVGALQRTQVWFLLPYDGLTVICNFRAEVSNIPFWPPRVPGVHIVNRHAYGQKANPYT